MSRPATRPLLFAVLLGVAWTLSHTVFPAQDVVWLSLVPTFLLVLPLLAGRYLGERRIAQLAAGRRPHRRRRLAPIVPHARPLAARIDGGLLLARRLAGRAPPAACLAA